MKIALKFLAKFLAGFLMIALTLIYLVESANAQNNEIYKIEGISITADGKNASEARAAAEAKAQRSAFGQLLQRLTIDESFIGSFSNDEIADMVSSKEINDEKITSANYSATFNISFSEDFVSNMLEEKNIVKGKSKGDNYLILPIKITKNKSLLWERENDWRTAWDKLLQKENKKIIKLPIGSNDEVITINVAALENPQYSDLESLLGKYNANTALIVYYDFDKIENKVTILLTSLTETKKKQVRLSFVNVNQLKASDLAEIVAKKTIDYILTSENTDKESKSAATIDILITNLQDWLRIENRLKNMDFINEMEMVSISRDLVRVHIKYNGGDPIILFSKYNFILAPQTSGEYFLSSY